MGAIVTGREYACGNIYVREMVFPCAGDFINGHAHNFDHATYCVRGELFVERLDSADSSITLDATTLRAGDRALIEAGVLHRITAKKEDSRGDCIYAHRTPQGEIVQTATGWFKGVS
jgi:quercetin dioxygenase-like cupin family protein